ncbi:hypothetical protein D3C84_433730 [compost metagenome]|jgi:type IV secretion system protein VirB1
MRAKHVLLSLALLIIPIANAELPSPSGKPTHEQTALPPAVLATPDPIADLFPGAPGLLQTAPPPTAATKQPIYESWDVLRQYPRYESLAPASVPEPKASEPKKETKEKTDVQ